MRFDETLRRRVISILHERGGEQVIDVSQPFLAPGPMPRAIALKRFRISPSSRASARHDVGSNSHNKVMPFLRMIFAILEGGKYVKSILDIRLGETDSHGRRIPDFILAVGILPVKPVDTL